MQGVVIDYVFDAKKEIEALKKELLDEKKSFQIALKEEQDMLKKEIDWIVFWISIVSTTAVQLGHLANMSANMSATVTATASQKHDDRLQVHALVVNSLVKYMVQLIMFSILTCSTSRQGMYGFLHVLFWKTVLEYVLERTYSGDLLF